MTSTAFYRVLGELRDGLERLRHDDIGIVEENTTMNKPILFHDIDGVIFGYYGPAGHLQLRPGVADWVQWVHEHFTVIWFSVRRETQVRELMQSLCL